MSIYDRLAKWNCDISRLGGGKEMFDLYIKGKDIEYIYNNRVQYTNRTDEEIPLSVDGLHAYIKVLRSNPINSTEVVVNYGSLEYLHYSYKSRKSVNDYDSETVDLIKEIYPDYSLQKEYQKLAIRKRYSDKLEAKYSKFLTEWDRDLYKITFDPDTSLITISTFKRVFNAPEFLVEVDNGYAEIWDNYVDIYNYKIKDASLDIFHQMVAFISPMIYIVLDYSKYISLQPSHKLPFQRDLDF
jgi:hypothetical protein